METVGTDMLSLTKDTVRINYVQQNSEKASRISQQTLRNKLRALQYFCEYVCKSMRNETDPDAIQLTELGQCLPQWRKSLRTRCTNEEVAKHT